ncbi:MAG: PhnD/SsuA/transferrin family substrate-binding protein, partial [Thiovulaceae bacterium]|nr:PhnD/SsuA/transferrin family substrate-binding protein [Sulfurimonadaceae bacterium]
QPLINNSIVAKRGVDPEIVAQMRRILLELDTTPQGQKLLENAGFAGFAHAKNGDYDVVIEFLRDYNEELKR